MESKITDDLDIDFVGAYQPATYKFGGHRRNIRPLDLADIKVPIMSSDKPIVIPERKKKKQK